MSPPNQLLNIFSRPNNINQVIKDKHAHYWDKRTSCILAPVVTSLSKSTKNGSHLTGYVVNGLIHFIIPYIVTKLCFTLKGKNTFLTKKGYMSDTRISVTHRKMRIDMADRLGSANCHQHILLLRLYSVFMIRDPHSPVNQVDHQKL